MTADYYASLRFEAFLDSFFSCTLHEHWYLLTIGVFRTDKIREVQMQPNEVKTGAKFYTRITNRVDIPVVVIADTREGTKRYVIQRTDNGAILPQLRGAGQLHLTPGPWEPGNPNARKKGPGLARANGRRRVATMGDATQAELLERLSKLDAPTTRFLVELINSIGSTAVAPSNKVVRAAK